MSECEILETEIVSSTVATTEIESVELAEQGPPGPPGVTILAALPVFDTDGTEHAIRFNSDLTLQFFDADGESTPIRLLSEPL